jgi:hypothetical protein
MDSVLVCSDAALLLVLLRREQIEAFLTRLSALQQRLRKMKQFNHEARIKEDGYSANESNCP